jgi:hypothetical protein
MLLSSMFVSKEAAKASKSPDGFERFAMCRLYAAAENVLGYGLRYRWIIAGGAGNSVQAETYLASDSCHRSKAF